MLLKEHEEMLDGDRRVIYYFGCNYDKIYACKEIVVANTTLFQETWSADLVEQNAHAEYYPTFCHSVSYMHGSKTVTTTYHTFYVDISVYKPFEEYKKMYEKLSTKSPLVKNIVEEFANDVINMIA